MSSAVGRATAAMPSSISATTQELSPTVMCTGLSASCSSLGMDGELHPRAMPPDRIRMVTATMDGGGRGVWEIIRLSANKYRHDKIFYSIVHTNKSYYILLGIVSTSAIIILFCCS